jgi:hypothetical protein
VLDPLRIAADVMVVSLEYVEEWGDVPERCSTTR